MLRSTKGIHLYTKNYLIDKPQARILITHGLAEHCERYAHVAEAFNKVGFDVYTFDLRGHGKSGGTKAFVKNIDEYREDLEVVYNSVPKDLPFFMLGHSMGGLITMVFLMFRERNDIKGVVFSGAALEIGEDITPLTQKVISFIGKFTPKLRTVKLDAKILTRDPEQVKLIDKDPLIYHGGTKAGLGLAIINAINAMKPQFKDFNFPVLIMHGGSDKLTNIDGSISLFDQCKTKDKTLKIWEGAFHEIFNEINRKEIIDYTATWLKARI